MVPWTILSLITLNPLRTHLQARARSRMWMTCWQQRCSTLGERGELDSSPVLVALEHVKPGKSYQVTCAFLGLQGLFCRRGPKAERG